MLPVFAQEPKIHVAKYMSTTRTKIYIRSGPGTQYKVINKVGKYTPFKILSRTADRKWIKIQDYRGRMGWIGSDAVSDAPAVIVKETEANIRKGPGTNYETIWQAVAGVPFRCLKRNGHWLHVLDVDDETGWIYDILVWGVCY